MRLKLFLSALAFAISAGHTLADCTTPSGFKRVGSGNWRLSATLPGATAWERFPASVPSDIPTGIKNLAKLSTGLTYTVRTNADQIRMCWDSPSDTLSEAIWSPTGKSGIDVYYRDFGTTQWRYMDVGEAISTTSNVKLSPFGTTADREIMVYLPAGRRISLLRFEVPTAATVSTPAAPTAAPIVVLGSSIVMGSGTTRPGMLYPAMLGRALDADVINLGLSGSCQMLTGIRTLIETTSPSAIVLDCFPNMTAAQITTQMPAFVEGLALAFPTVPIYIVEARLNQAGGPHPTAVSDWQAKNTAAQTIFGNLSPTYPNLHLIPSEDLLGDDYEATVDGSHPSDLGHMRYKTVLLEHMAPALRMAASRR